MQAQSSTLHPLRLLKAVARRLMPSRPRGPAQPGNWQAPQATREAIAYQVEYGLQGGELLHRRLKALGLEMTGSRVLEIGPGIVFGSMAYLRAAGVHVAVTDRWLAPWSKNFHAPVYSTIADKLEGKDGFDVTPIRQMVEAKAYVPGTIECLTYAAEDLTAIKDAEYDGVVSNAVLEHIEHPGAAFKELYRVTRPGGAGLHQVDFRDHRNFDRPLEHVLMDPEAFGNLNKSRSFEYGSQLRQPQYAALLKAAGFEIEHYDSNDRANAAYLDDVIRRLASSAPAGNLHADLLDREALADLSGLFFLKKPLASNEAVVQPLAAGEV